MSVCGVSEVDAALSLRWVFLQEGQWMTDRKEMEIEVHFLSAGKDK